MKVFEVVAPKAEIVKSLPSVVLYHGTTEEHAKQGLKSDDFNSDWIRYLDIKNVIHMTDNLDVARAYAVSGISKANFKKIEDKLDKVGDEAKNKFGADPFRKFNFQEKGVTREQWNAARNWLKVRTKELEDEMNGQRGKGGFVISANFTPSNILVFKEPFSLDNVWEYSAVIRQFRGKFDSIFFPASNLKPDNYKGKRLPKSGYYMILKPNQVKNQKVV